MTINEHDIERFLSGDLPDDHPAWAQTAAFTQRLDTAFPHADGPLDAATLADVVNEARRVHTTSALQRNLTPPPVKPARLVLAVAAAAVVAISSGVGMAAALNTGLNHQASDLKMQVPVAPVSQFATPEPTPEPSEEAAPLETEKPKIVHKTVTHKPKATTPKPTKKATESHDDHEDGDDEHEDEHDD
jgi:hypothetical protein